MLLFNLCLSFLRGVVEVLFSSVVELIYSLSSFTNLLFVTDDCYVCNVDAAIDYLTDGLTTYEFTSCEDDKCLIFLLMLDVFYCLYYVAEVTSVFFLLFVGEDD